MGAEKYFSDKKTIRYLGAIIDKRVVKGKRYRFEERKRWEDLREI
jgi:hypothetical protein